MATAPQTFAEVLPPSFTAVAAGGIAASQASLPAELREFHRRLLTDFLHSGQPPQPERLDAIVADLGLETEPALAALARDRGRLPAGQLPRRRRAGRGLPGRAARRVRPGAAAGGRHPHRRERVRPIAGQTVYCGQS
jgi:hypothetical protein